MPFHELTKILGEDVHQMLILDFRVRGREQIPRGGSADSARGLGGVDVDADPAPPIDRHISLDLCGVKRRVPIDEKKFTGLRIALRENSAKPVQYFPGRDGDN